MLKKALKILALSLSMILTTSCSTVPYDFNPALKSEYYQVFGGRCAHLHLEKDLGLVETLEGPNLGMDIDFVIVDIDNNVLVVCGDQDAEGPAPKHCEAFVFEDVLVQTTDDWESFAPINAIPDISYDGIVKSIKKCLENSNV